MTSKPFPNSFPNEQERAFLSMLYSRDEVFPSRLAAWSKEIVFDDIDYAIARLLPLVYLRLRHTSSETELNGKIKGFYKRAWVMNQRLLSATRDAVALLNEHNIPVLAVKGLPLLLGAYKDMGARFMGDADILIPPQYAKTAIASLTEAGWKSNSPYLPLKEYFSNETFSRLVKEVAFVTPQGIEIDVHWRLFEYSHMTPEALSFETLWERATPLTDTALGARSVAPDDLLLHVIVHGAEGNPHRTLRWVPDALALLQSHDINWTRFMETATQGGWEADTAFAFAFLAQEKLYTLPEEISKRIDLSLVTKKALRRYYRKANTSYRIAGRFPTVWHTYWQSAASRSLLQNLYELPAYLAHAWGFVRVRDLLPFVFHKYAKRVLARRAA